MTQQYDASTPTVARHSDSMLTPHTAPEVMSFSGVPGLGSTDKRMRRPKALRSEKEDRTI